MSDIKPPERFALTPGDLDSPTWARLKKHLLARVAALNLENEQDLDAEKTAKLRGRLAEVKGLLSLEKNPPPG